MTVITAGFISIFDKTAQKAVSLWTAAVEDSKDGVAVVPAQDDMARIVSIFYHFLLHST